MTATPPDVLVVSPFQPGPGASGVSTACRHLVAGLAASGAAGDVVVLSLAERAGRDRVDGVRVEWIRRQQRGALLTNGWPDFVQALRWLRGSGFRPGVVHGQGFAGEGLTAVRLARRLRVPGVVTVHGMVDKETRMYSDALRARLARRVMTQTLRRADGIVFVSPYRSGELVLRPETEGRVVENAISEAAFGESRARPQPSILYAGFVGPRKRLADVVAALAVVRRTLPDATLRVAGPATDAGYAQRVRADVARLGLDDAVEFLGPLAQEDLYREYRTCGVLALASEEENAPQVIAEAMAAGLPVVATRVGGVAWMVEDGRQGRVVPVGDVDALAAALTGVLGDDGTWAAMSAAARAEAERFRPARVAGLTAEFYSELVAARRR